MGSYRSEDEALVGLARQLTDAYGDARSREDQDYACDSIGEFLSEFRTTAPAEALLAILDLPLTAETYPLVDEAQAELVARGADVVQVLLAATLGEVYAAGGSAPERAAETLDLVDRSVRVRGLVAVLCGRAGGEVKGAALDALVALGAFAEPALVAALDDPDGGEWARAVLEQIRFGDAALDGVSETTGPADTQGHARESFLPGEGDDDQASAGHGIEGRQADASGPDRQPIEDAFEEFRRRFEQESGGESTAS